MCSVQQTRLGYLVDRFKKVIKIHGIELESAQINRSFAVENKQNNIKNIINNLTEDLQKIYNDTNSQYLIIHAFAHILSIDQYGKLPYTNLSAFIKSSSNLPAENEYNKFLKESICF